MEEYIKTLLEQIRCKKAQPYIEEEIRGHMEDQIATNLSMGMTREEAVYEAVQDMGSPVEAGVALDQIHRPQMAWDMIGIMGIISIFGILVHAMIGGGVYGSDRFALHTVLGFIVMLGIYRMDYSFIAKHAKVIAAGFLIILFLTAYTDFGLSVNGQSMYFYSAGIHFNVFALMLLYVPVFGAVLYQYYGRGYDGIAKAIVWMIMPVVFSLHLPNLSLAVILFAALAVILSLAVYKGWFRISKKKFFIFFWGATILMPVIMLIAGVGFRLLADYQIARLHAFFTNSGDANYLTQMLRMYLMKSKFIGGNGVDIAANLPEFNTSFIFNYIISTYGSLAGVLLCTVLAFLIIKIFMISLRQKNQLGMIMGCGCGTVLLLNTLVCISQNLGLLPLGQSFLPFFSYGGSFIIVSYAMMGLVLSIYRYKNIFPVRFRMQKDLVVFHNTDS